jgi:hypothetical protein
MTKENIFRDVRKLIYTLNKFGNCLVPSTHEDNRDTTAIERVNWLMKKAKEEHGLTPSDVEDGIMGLVD